MTKSRLALAVLALGLLTFAAGGMSAGEETRPGPAGGVPPAPVSTGAAPEVDSEELLSFLKPCAERLNALEARDYTTRSLVAILPDPFDSHYQREFDLLLTAVRRALEHPDRGYLQDRHCLSWGEATGQKEASAFHRSLPGVVLFRRDPSLETDFADPEESAADIGEPGSEAEEAEAETGKSCDEADQPDGEGAEPQPRNLQCGEVLTLFLVGEVPAWGVQTRALEVALDFAVETSSSPGSSPAPLSILGPTFSGSTRSLAVTLSTWRQEYLRGGHPAPHFDIVSGSATSPEIGGVLENVLGDGFSYRSAATDDNRLQDCLWNVFVPHRLGLRTEFSAAAPEPGRTEEKKTENGAVALLVESSLYGRGFDRKGFHVLPFPMHISQLRAEHEKQRRKRAQKSEAESEPNLGSTPPTLELDLDDHRSTLDQFPVFDVKGTSRTQDLVLANILTTISRNRIEVAAIVSSNTMDKLFLAEVIRSYAPDVRLVTLEGDLLLTHPQSTPATLGMLVVSSNPLTDPDPLTTGTGVSLQFPSDMAQGVYEAMRMLLEDYQPAQEVWLSIVGRGSLDPLDRIVFADQDIRSCSEIAETDRAASSPPSTSQPRVPPPRGWALVLSLASLLILFTLYEGIRRERFLGIDWRQFAPWPLSNGTCYSAAPLVHGLIVLIPVATAVPYLLMSGPYLRYLAARAEVITAAMLLLPKSWDQAMFLLILTCPAALGLTGLLLVTGLAQRTWTDLWALRGPRFSVDPDKPSGEEIKNQGRFLQLGRSILRVAGVVAPFALAMAGILVAVLWILKGYHLFGTPSAWLTLLLQRAISLGSGVSPLLPILLFLSVAVGWVLSSLWRHRTLDELPPPLKDATQKAGAPKTTAARTEEHDAKAASRLTDDLRDAIAQVRRAVDPATFWIRDHALLWCLLVLVPALYLSFYYAGRRGPLLRGVETRTFDWWLSLLFLAAVVLLLGSALSLRRGWGALRRWLQLVRSIRFSSGGDEQGTECLWLQKLREVAGLGRRSREELRALRSDALEALEKALDDEAASEAPGALLQLHRRIEGAANRGSEPSRHLEVWMALLEWSGQHVTALSEGRHAQEAAEDTADQGQPEKEEEKEKEPALVTKARQLFVWQTAYFTREALTQLGQLMGFLMGGLFVLFLAVSTYPFEPHRVLTLYVGGLTLLGVLLTAMILFQMEKDDLIHQLSATGDGVLGRYRGLMGRLALFVGLPLLSVLASQVPVMRRLLFQWLEPVLKSLL